MGTTSGSGTFTKGLGLLLALGKYPDGVGVSELARDVGLPVSTVHRLLVTMVSMGFASLDSERRRYSLGLRVFELSHRIALVRELSEVALPVMRRITEATGEPTLMSVLDGREMVYVERVEGWRGVQIWGSVGGRGPLYCTSLGKALLAYLPEEEREEIIGDLRLEPFTASTITDPDELREELERTRELGYAMADEEHEEGVRAVGVPVMSSRGRPVAAICVAAPVFRVSKEDLERFIPMLREAAWEIGVQRPRGGAVLTQRRKERRV
jgi:IclR family acetate operon transcriptional repressor